MVKFSYGRLQKTLENKAGNFQAIQEATNIALTQQSEAIDRWYEIGGELFFQWAKEHYTLPTGAKLRWVEPFLPDYYRLIGEPRVRDAYVLKGAQVGYSESLFAFTGFFTVVLRLPLGFGFESQTKQHDMVSTRIKVAFSYCQPIQELSNQYKQQMKLQDRDNLNAITIGGVKISFFYGKKAGNASNTPGRQASSALSSFSACAIIADEYELWNTGILDVSRKRMEASILPSELVRAGSTPGHVGGIVDKSVSSCKYIFEWHVECPHCNFLQAISAFGNLLKPVNVMEHGKPVVCYLDKSGRPLDWYYADSENRRDTAYVGCRNCSGELSHDVIAQGSYQCSNTGITIKDFFHQCRQSEQIVDRVAIKLPKLASVKFNASIRIKALFETDNPEDEVQQGLGLPFTVGVGKIQWEIFRECIGLSLPETLQNRKPDMVVAGIDQGKYGDLYVINAIYLSSDSSKELKWRNAHFQLLEYGTIDNFKNFGDKIKEYNILLVGMDSEPAWDTASEYCYANPPKGPTVISLENFADDYDVERPQNATSTTGQYGGLITGIMSDSEYGVDYWRQYTSGMNTLGQVYLFDQVNLDNKQFKREKRNLKTHDPKKVPVYNLDRTYWLDMVRDRIYMRAWHLPKEINYNPKDKNNFVSQYLASDRIVVESAIRKRYRWIDNGNPDHFFHASCFCEAAVFLSMYEQGV